MKLHVNSKALFKARPKGLFHRAASRIELADRSENLAAEERRAGA
ncbi:hypothetical protein OAL71_02550 [Phycisphaerales bacterium]|nr:hypothetical protein [Phycisphaerales bacterium]